MHGVLCVYWYLSVRVWEFGNTSIHSGQDAFLILTKGDFGNSADQRNRSDYKAFTFIG